MKTRNLPVAQRRLAVFCLWKCSARLSDWGNFIQARITASNDSGPGETVLCFSPSVQFWRSFNPYHKRGMAAWPWKS